MIIRGKHSAFTLVELMTVVAIVAIMAAIATPSMRNMILNNRLAGFTNDMVSTVSAARGQAINLRQPVVIAANNNDWMSGWRAFVDSDRNGAFTAGEEVVRDIEAYPSSLSVNGAAPGNTITITSKGAMQNLGGWGDLTVCDTRGAGRVISIAGAGNVSVTKLKVGEC